MSRLLLARITDLEAIAARRREQAEPQQSLALDRTRYPGGQPSAQFHRLLTRFNQGGADALNGDEQGELLSQLVVGGWDPTGTGST